MRYRLITYSVVAAVVLGVVSLLWVPMPAAQYGEPGAAAKKAIPRTADGHPDLNGFWLEPTGPGLAFYGKNEVGDAGLTVRAPDGSLFYNHASAAEIGVQRPTGNQPQAAAPRSESELYPPYKPEWMAKVKATKENSMGNLNPDDPMLVCKPLGVPRMGIGSGLHVVQNPQSIAFLYEKAPGLVYRIIYMDGRPHPENVDTSHLGHSVGRWEGDTLVIDTVGLNDDTLLAEIERGGPTVGVMFLHSDQEHVVERITHDGDGLIYQATVEDPVAFTKPWVMRPRRVSRAAKEDFIMPQMCIELDREHILFKNTPGFVNTLEGLTSRGN